MIGFLFEKQNASAHKRPRFLENREPVPPPSSRFGQVAHFVIVVICFALIIKAFINKIQNTTIYYLSYTVFTHTSI